MDSNGDRPSMNGTWYLADNVEIINIEKNGPCFIEATYRK